jgi:hypothetical protein
MRGRAIAFLSCLAGLAALPAPASASPVLTETFPVPIPVGTTVLATTIGQPIVTASPANYTCKSATMHGNVARNSGTQIEIEFSSLSVSSCESIFGGLTLEAKNLPWCWRTTAVADSFELRGGKCSEAAKPLTVMANSCPTTRTAITGTFKTSPEEFWMTPVSQEFVPEAGFNCPKISLDFNWKVETAVSPFTALKIS